MQDFWRSVIYSLININRAISFDAVLDEILLGVHLVDVCHTPLNTPGISMDADHKQQKKNIRGNLMGGTF